MKFQVLSDLHLEFLKRAPEMRAMGPPPGLCCVDLDDKDGRVSVEFT